MKTQILDLKVSSYSNISIIKLESGINVKFKKKYDLLNNTDFILSQDLINMLKETIYITLDVYQCKIGISENEIGNMIGSHVYAVDSISITSKIDYLKNHTLLTIFLPTHENNGSSAGLFWQFPIMSENNLVNENQVII
jgi:hypothetical protein